MKSTSSVFTRIDGFTIAVSAPLQDTHAQCSEESEFYVNDLGMRTKINLRCDAKAARTLAQRQGLSKRTRHVKVKDLYVQDLVIAREVEVSRVPTETNLADIGTKHLPSHRLEFLKSLMGKSSENAMTFRADSGEQGGDSKIGSVWRQLELADEPSKAVGMRQEKSRVRRVSPQRVMTETCEPIELHCYELKCQIACNENCKNPVKPCET